MVNHRGSIAWTTDLEARATLRRLHEQTDPVLSLRQIADRMGVTKNAIMGAAHRMNLPQRPHAIKKLAPGETPKPTHKKRVPVSSLPPLPSAVAPAQTRPEAKLDAPEHNSAAEPVHAPAQAPRLRQQATGNGQCCWPIGDPKHPAFRMCCEQTLAHGKPYCPEHHSMAYTNAEDIRRESVALPKVEEFARQHAIVPPIASGMSGLLVAVNNYRRAHGLTPYSLQRGVPR